MFAVVKAGGKQYRVAAKDVITVARRDGEPGDAIAFDEVILFGDEGKTEFGAPAVAGVTVAGEIVEHTRGAKVIAFKKRRRQNSRRKRGHRQDLTVVRITAIGSHTGEPAKAKRAAKPKAAASEAPEAAPAPSA